tara:strand:- start:1002 stop:2195 length:1194 start_codon:yes stop_codon:yes gene_type:complete
MLKIQHLLIYALSISVFSFGSDHKRNKSNVIVGANQILEYQNIIKNKRIGIIANHTSVIFKDNGEYTHLVDSLINLNYHIKKIFAPEHGFRGTKPNGENINDEIDENSGLQIISLHGKQRNYGEIKSEDLNDIDILIFDLQDVGVRFYTHISILHYAMLASSVNDIPIIVFDRPNPNSHYVDGPILDLKNKSFVGLHPVPIVYGLTIGEYAKMINGEDWLGLNKKADLTVIKLKNYNRYEIYELPIPPSPNLPNSKAINLYPSLCLFEGTNVSVGRGTNLQFQIYGSPNLNEKTNKFYFTPKKNIGSKYPKNENILCFGKDLRSEKVLNEINLDYIIDAYNGSTNKTSFFNSYFIKLSGDDNLKNNIVLGKNSDDIKKEWKEGIDTFEKLRKKYFLY